MLEAQARDKAAKAQVEREQSLQEAAASVGRDPLGRSNVVPAPVQRQKDNGEKSKKQHYAKVCCSSLLFSSFSLSLFPLPPSTSLFWQSKV